MKLKTSELCYLAIYFTSSQHTNIFLSTLFIRTTYTSHLKRKVKVYAIFNSKMLNTKQKKNSKRNIAMGNIAKVKLLIIISYY